MTDEHIDITELFSRDPMSLTDTDIDNIIAEMRKKRAMFKAAPASAAKGGPKQLTDKQQKAAKLDLGSIDLGI